MHPMFGSAALALGRAFITRELQHATFGKPHSNPALGRRTAVYVCKALHLKPARLGELFEAACRGYAAEVAAIANTIHVNVAGFDAPLYYGRRRLNPVTGKREWFQVNFLDMTPRVARQKAASFATQRDVLDLRRAMLVFAAEKAEQTGATTLRQGLAAAGLTIQVYIVSP